MAKQKFNKKTLYTKTCVDNILSIYDQDFNVETTNWYLEAHTFAESLALNHNVELLKVCGIIAAFSPLKEWNQNKSIVRDFLKTGKAKHTGVFVDKAQDILECTGEQSEIADILRGNKITSFFLNIAFPFNTSIVTIDRHAQDICLGQICLENKRKMTSGQYEFFVNCFTIAANYRDVTPSSMQAITWVKWRILKKKDVQEVDLPF